MQGLDRFRESVRKGQIMGREILSLRDKHIERLLQSMPYELGADAPEVRRWTEIWTREASRFQIDQAKRNALAKGRA